MTHLPPEWIAFGWTDAQDILTGPPIPPGTGLDPTLVGQRMQVTGDFRLFILQNLGLWTPDNIPLENRRIFDPQTDELRSLVSPNSPTIPRTHRPAATLADSQLSPPYPQNRMYIQTFVYTQLFQDVVITPAPNPLPAGFRKIGIDWMRLGHRVEILQSTLDQEQIMIGIQEGEIVTLQQQVSKDQQIITGLALRNSELQTTLTQTQAELALCRDGQGSGASGNVQSAGSIQMTTTHAPTTGLSRKVRTTLFGGLIGMVLVLLILAILCMVGYVHFGRTALHAPSPATYYSTSCIPNNTIYSLRCPENWSLVSVNDILVENGILLSSLDSQASFFVLPLKTQYASNSYASFLVNFLTGYGASNVQITDIAKNTTIDQHPWITDIAAFMLNGSAYTGTLYGLNLNQQTIFILTMTPTIARQLNESIFARILESFSLIL